MAEIIQKDGTWAFDGDALRLTPGRDKNVSLLRKTLGEIVVPQAQPQPPRLPALLERDPRQRAQR
ncbi:hypothetical protein ACUALU_30920, partial [Nocardiopsis changdeensis]